MANRLPWLERNTLVLPHLLLCGTEADYKKAVKHCNVHQPGEWLRENFNGCTHTLESKGKITCIVCINFEDAAKHPIHEVLGIIAHEGMHVYQSFIESIGERNPSREFEAYSVQMIIQRLFESYLIQTKRKKM